jgi:hypothetical protein
VQFQLFKGPRGPAAETAGALELMLRAQAAYAAAESEDLDQEIAAKTAELRRYDVQEMDRAVAIIMWGRSGSLLLASYLDGHEDTVLLPEISGQRLYEFYNAHPELTLRDKLLAYAVCEPGYPRFFEGNFAISPARYYAAVEAIVRFFAQWPVEFLESRRAFFLFAHIGYNLALGRRPVSSRPLIVFAQHDWDETAAGYLVEDFPQAKFIHTIRDPISSCDGVFHSHFGKTSDQFPRTYIVAPHSALLCLIEKDRPHSGMESRTRTVRFEDLQADTAGTMHDLADWLGLGYQPVLLESTFNGVPYVITRDGVSWSGRRTEQLQRHSWHFASRDRALMYALLYENFTEWDYPCPKIFRSRMARGAVFAALMLLPMKMELNAAEAVFKRRILPALGRGQLPSAAKSLAGIGLCRLKIIALLAPAFFRRCLAPPVLLQLGVPRQAQQRREAAVETLQETR